MKEFSDPAKPLRLGGLIGAVRSLTIVAALLVFEIALDLGNRLLDRL